MSNCTLESPRKHHVNTAISQSPIREALKRRLLTECLEVVSACYDIDGEEALAVLRRIRHA